MYYYIDIVLNNKSRSQSDNRVNLNIAPIFKLFAIFRVRLKFESENRIWKIS